MKFIYLDESGNSGYNLSDAKHPIHFISGILIDESKMEEVEKSIKSLHVYFLPHSTNYDFEFHGSEMFAGNGYYKSYPLELRLSILESLVGIAEKNDIKFFSQGIDKYKHNRKYINPYPPHNVAFMYLLEKLDKFLLEQKSKGLLIMDKAGSKSQNLINDCRLYREKGTTYGVLRKESIDNIIDNVLYVDSQNSLYVQLADVISYIYSTAVVNKILGNNSSYHRKYLEKLAIRIKQFSHYSFIDPQQ